MLLFLHSLRNAVIVLIAIPASLISTFIAMYVLGYTLNLMTLLAMSLVIGILVDDSIVVLENIYRHLEMGKDKRQAALDGRNEIGFTALSITMVDVVVFLPIVFVNSVISDVLRQFSVVVVVATLLSLLVCFTLTPWLASRFSKLTHLNPKNPLQWVLIQFEYFLTVFTDTYAALVKWFLQYKIVGFAFILSTFVATGWVMSLGIMGEEFFKEGDDRKFILKVEYAPKTPLAQNNLMTREIEKFLLQKTDIEYVAANIGGSTSALGGEGISGKHKSELTVRITKEAGIPTEKYMIATRDELLKRFSGVKIQVAKLGIGSGVQAPIEVILSGIDREKVLAEAHKLKALIENIDGTNNVKLSAEDGNPEVKIDLDREKMAKLGLSMDIVGATLQNALSGNNDSKYREKGTEYDIRVMLDAFDRQNPEDVKNIIFTNRNGEQIQLKQFAAVRQSTGSSILERKNRRSSVSISSYVLGTGTGNIAVKIQEVLDKNPLPADVSMEWGGDIKNQNESFGALGAALLISIVCMYLLMVALYDNFVYPFVVLFSIPVALTGALLALNLTMNNMGIFTMLGMIMLLGLVAKNAILLVDFTNQAKAEGMTTKEALVQAVKERMRPILMTTVAMVIGMLPIAMATGAGAEWKNGLAWVLIGGLSSSMFLTLILVPLMYSVVDWVAEKVGGWRRKPQVKEELVVS
jgi:HAE1 family hydrophobic/amphiphilic exporter-1